MIYNSKVSQLEPNLPNHRTNQTRVRVRIPKKYHQEPVLSNLISQQGLKVNIIAALLAVNAKEDGWFDLQLEGSAEQIDSALIYLSDLDVEIWQESSAGQDGW